MPAVKSFLYYKSRGRACGSNPVILRGSNKPFPIPIRAAARSSSRAAAASASSLISLRRSFFVPAHSTPAFFLEAGIAAVAVVHAVGLCLPVPQRLPSFMASGSSLREAVASFQCTAPPLHWSIAQGRRRRVSSDKPARHGVRCSWLRRCFTG